MRHIVYMIMLAGLLTSCTSETRYIVKGKIDGADDVTFFLQKRDSIGKVVTIDSAISKNGSFTIKGGMIDYPQLIQLVAGNTGMRTPFYLENSKISIVGSLDSLYKAKVSGSKTQNEYQAFVESNKPLSKRYSDIYLQYQEASQVGDAERISMLTAQADSVQNAAKEMKKNFVINNPGSYISPSILGSMEYEIDAVEFETLVNSMDSAVAATPQGKMLKERVEVLKTVAIGQKAPDFTLNDANGKSVSLSTLLGSRLLLLDFWAAWCGPCRKENPNLVKTYNKYHKDGFDILGISLDRRKDDWLKAVKDDKLNWTHLSDLKYWNSPIVKLYAISAIPSNLLLDETGTIIARNLRGEALAEKIDEILGN